MAFHVYHRSGECESNPPVDSLDDLYEELRINDREHPCVSVEHESAWSIEAYPSGLLVWQNVEDGEPRHMKSVHQEKVLKLWRLLTTGEIDAINSEPWEHGYG